MSARWHTIGFDRLYSVDSVDSVDIYYIMWLCWMSNTSYILSVQQWNRNTIKKIQFSIFWEVIDETSEFSSSAENSFFRVKVLLIIANHLCVMSMYFMPLPPIIGGFGPTEIITLIVVFGVDYPILHHYIEV